MAFVFEKAYVASRKLITAPKLKLQAALLTAWLKRNICAFSMTTNQASMWSDSSSVLQCIYSNEKQPINASNVSEIFGNNTVDQWNDVTTKNNLADAGTRGKSASLLLRRICVKGPHFFLNYLKISVRTEQRNYK